eukprot:6173462-Pleurochrysis_carterae.AAC.1
MVLRVAFSAGSLQSQASLEAIKKMHEAELEKRQVAISYYPFAALHEMPFLRPDASRVRLLCKLSHKLANFRTRLNCHAQPTHGVQVHRGIFALFKLALPSKKDSPFATRISGQPPTPPRPRLSASSCALPPDDFLLSQPPQNLAGPSPVDALAISRRCSFLSRAVLRLFLYGAPPSPSRF